MSRWKHMDSVWGRSGPRHEEAEVGEKVSSLLILGFPPFSAHLSW